MVEDFVFYSFVVKLILFFIIYLKFFLFKIPSPNLFLSFTLFQILSFSYSLCFFPVFLAYFFYTYLFLSFFLFLLFYLSSIIKERMICIFATFFNDLPHLFHSVRNPKQFPLFPFPLKKKKNFFYI